MIHFTIPGEPVAQGRPRATSIGGHARVYQPKKSMSYQAKVATFATEAMRVDKQQPLVGAVSVEIEAVFERAASSYRKKNPRKREARTGRPDVDNLIKAIMDGMAGVVYANDSQVAIVCAAKYTGAQGEMPGVTVSVNPFYMEGGE